MAGPTSFITTAAPAAAFRLLPSARSVLLLCGLCPLARGAGFLTQLAPQGALVDALACGQGLGDGGFGDLQAIERVVLPMWLTLPKNGHERISRRSLRYLAHRYFMQTSSISIRGFEPLQGANLSTWDQAAILNHQVPELVESMLESQHAVDKGFSLDDAVAMIVVLGRLVSSADAVLLDKVLSEAGAGGEAPRAMERRELTRILEDYMLYWTHGEEEARSILRHRDYHLSTWAGFGDTARFVDGLVRSHDFARRRQGSSLAQRYTYDDALEIAGAATRSFASYSESECSEMRSHLMTMDPQGTGRVPLSRFYAASTDAVYRFGESEAYLRQLGALDETSRWQGKQVIIANYLQAASNCIVSSPFYRVCCSNPCEGILGDIESAVGAPAATAERIMAVVGNVTAPAKHDDGAPALDADLAEQLVLVGERYGGEVPLHGRLFAQWLHRVFPQDCPVPYTASAASGVTPKEFGANYEATPEEMQRHIAAAATDSTCSAGNGTENRSSSDDGLDGWASQWSLEDELIVEYPAARRSSPRAALVLGGLFSMASFGAIAISRGRQDAGKLSHMEWRQAHIV